MTKEQAMASTYRQEFYHRTLRDSKGLPVKVRQNGSCRTWKRDPQRFELPCKYGLSKFHTITNQDCHEWCLTEAEAMGTGEPVREAMKAVRRANS